MSTKKRQNVEQSDETKPRKSRINTFMNYPGGDWLMNAEKALEIILEILQSLGVEFMASIFLPGVGLSALPKALFIKGYTNLYLTDIEPESITKQISDFAELKALGRDTSSMHISCSDALSRSGFEFVPTNSMDVIIDKGFLDVFLRQGQSKVVWAELTRTINKEHGIFIGLSMFHRKWRGILSKSKFPIVRYASVAVPRYSRTRPEVAAFSNPIAVLVTCTCATTAAATTSKRTEEDSSAPLSLSLSLSGLVTALSSAASHELRDFHKLSTHDFPQDASNV